MPPRQHNPDKCQQTLWKTDQYFALRVHENLSRPLRVGEILAIKGLWTTDYRASQWAITAIDTENRTLSLLKLLSRVEAEKVDLLVETTRGI